MKEHDWVDVTKEEFDAFIKAYPNKLEPGTTFICEPPMLSYNDFTLARFWPESMIARVKLNESMKGHPAYGGEKNEYDIRKDVYEKLQKG